MDISEAIYIGQRAFITIGLICGPVLLIAMVVGMIISLLQAVTQVQEMTVVFVPKIIAVFIVMSLLGGWMLEEAVNFGTECFTSVKDIPD